MRNKSRRTMKYKSLAHLAIAAAVCLAYPEIASACGCGLGSVSLNTSQDSVNVYATAAAYMTGGCDADVTATITAPDMTTLSADDSTGSPPPPHTSASYSATVQKPFGTLYGTYSGSGTYFWTCDPATCFPSSGYASPPPPQSQLVRPTISVSGGTDIWYFGGETPS